LHCRHREAAAKTWNRVVATFGSFFAYYGRRGWVAVSPAIGRERHREKADRSQAGPIEAIPLEAFLGAPGHALRERLLWRMLYGPLPGPRVLLLDVEDLDVANKRGVVIGKGGNAEPIGWVGDGHRPIAPSLPHRAEGRTAVPLEFGPACAQVAPKPPGVAGYVSNGCHRCDTILGSWHLSESRPATGPRAALTSGS
jgi:hypothetical protein